MKEIWVFIGFCVAALICVGVVTCACEFIHKVWVHVNKPHTTEIGMQYNFERDWKGIIKLNGDGSSEIKPDTP